MKPLNELTQNLNVISKGKAITFEASLSGKAIDDLVKASLARLAYGMAMELTQTGVTALALSPGFLGPRYAPLVVGQPTGDGFAGTDGGLRVQNMARPGFVSRTRQDDRLALLQEMQADFMQTRPGAGTASRTAVTRRS